MIRLVLVNPNTNAATTEAMRVIAAEAVPAGAAVEVEALTAPFGVPLITEEDALAAAATAVAALAPEIATRAPAGVIVSAFGDPGLEELRALLPCPVTGIAEAAMLEAGAGGRRFAVATTTPALVAAITARAARYGLGEQMAGISLTTGDVHAVMADPDRLVEALHAACLDAVSRLGAEAVIIGGGPLAVAARALAPRCPVPLVEPIPAAVRLALRRRAPVRLR